MEHGPLVWHDMLRRVFIRQKEEGKLSNEADFKHCPAILFDAILADMIIRTAVLSEEREARRSSISYIAQLVDSVVLSLRKDPV